MFLNKLIENNEQLIKTAFKLHQNNEILPDTYLLDLDTIVSNGKAMVEVARPLHVQLYFMLKQIGRNPLVAKALMDAGFDGCIAVDYKEALLMIDNDIPLGNVGHLVQVPKAAMDRIIASRPLYVTVYSKKIIDAIDASAKRCGTKQKVLIRITDEDAHLYSGQIAGFDSKELEDLLNYLKEKENVEFGGITAFPAFLYDEKVNAITATENVNGIERAKKILKDLGVSGYMINLPSATCCASIPSIAAIGGGSGEPGHGLTGTTPLHKHSDQPEKVGYCYVSEVSHNFKDKAYLYAGGHYRRGHMENCLVGNNYEDAVMMKVSAPDDDSIDYHFELNGNRTPGETCVMCFRTQIFTTRSQVAVLSDGKIVGLYNSLGEKITRNW